MVIHRSRPRRLIAAALVPAAVALAACTGEKPTPEPGETGTSATEPVPVAEDFFEPAPRWSVAVPADAAVHVVGDHVVWLDRTGAIGAYDGAGAPVWTAEVTPFGYVEDGDIGADLRVLDERTVAVVQGGRTEPESPADPESLYRVWRYDVEDGPVGEPVDAAPTDGYQLSEHGVAFVRIDGDNELTPFDPSITVAANGEVTEHEPVTEILADTEVAAVPYMSVGGVAVRLLKGESHSFEGDAIAGFGGQGWNSIDIAPSAAPGTAASIVAVVGRHHVVARWHEAGGDGANDAFGLVDVAAGALVTAWPCPGAAHCAEPGRAVAFGSIDDEGRVFGRIDPDPDGAGAFDEREAGVVMVDADGRATTAHTAAGAPIGFVQGGLAVHYDPGSGTVTANRLAI